MSTTTTNYELVKPALTDAADITATNGNWDTIDTELKRVYDKAFEVQTGNRALVSNGSGAITASSVTDTELGYLSGVTSSVQTQLDGKQATVDGAASSIVSSDLTASKALVSDASGKVAASTVTATELGYLSGADSNVQDQIDTVFAESKEMVGDIMQTMGEIQDGWVETDGGILDNEEHPDLYGVFPYSGYVQTRTFSVSSSDAQAGLKFFKYENGYYVGFAYGTLFWRLPTETSWTTRNLTTTLLEGRYRVGEMDIMWDEANNQWLLAAHIEHSSSGYQGYVKLYSMPTLNGTLEKIFDNTNSGSGSTPVLLKKIDSYYFYKDASYDNNTAMNNKAKMYRATNPNGTWTNMTGSSYGMNYSIGFVGKFNDRWFLGGAKTITDDAKIYPAVAYSGVGQDLTSATWTVKTMGSGVSTDSYPSRYHFVNNIIYMPKCGAYLFATGEQSDDDSARFYSYDLDTFTSLGTSLTKRIGGEQQNPRFVDGILYLASGAYRDVEGNTGNPLAYPYIEKTISNMNLPIADPAMLRNGIYMTNSTTTIIENACTKSLPNITGTNGIRYKIKADGVPGTGG